MRIFAQRAYGASGWQQDVAVTVADGVISAFEPTSKTLPGDVLVDALLPAVSNLHSHAFQRAMAGMTEHRIAGRESFWTWRAQMYRHLAQLTPDHVEAIAAQAYVEMMEAGFAAVGEFHYLHHGPDGQPYDDLAEMSGRIMRAARRVGIGLTHLPVLYTYGGVDRRPLDGGQLRFGNSVDQFAQLADRCAVLARDMPADTKIGIAPHSLRATSLQDLRVLLEHRATGPVHIHIAEQTREVEEVEATFGARPVEWLLKAVEVDQRWCLIHATHMTEGEARALAQSGAIAGLCPVTEANLGDGIFAGPTFLAAGGGLGIGTDSNVNIALSEELRLLEYSQRLTHRARNVMVSEEGSVGESLYLGAAKGGAQALARNAGELAEGRLADLVAIDRSHPTLCLLRDDQLLDGFVFASGQGAVTDVWSAGRHQVRAGRHIARDAVRARYGQLLADLGVSGGSEKRFPNS